MLQNASFLAIVAVDTAGNESFKIWRDFSLFQSYDSYPYSPRHTPNLRHLLSAPCSMDPAEFIPIAGILAAIEMLLQPPKIASD